MVTSSYRFSTKLLIIFSVYLLKLISIHCQLLLLSYNYEYISVEFRILIKMVFLLEIALVAVTCLIAEGFIVGAVGNYETNQAQYNGKGTIYILSSINYITFYCILFPSTALRENHGVLEDQIFITI